MSHDAPIGHAFVIKIVMFIEFGEGSIVEHGSGDHLDLGLISRPAVQRVLHEGVLLGRQRVDAPWLEAVVEG